MSASVARSERILNRIAREDHLTPAAVEWLKTTLDPFHDNPLNCCGVPDGFLGNSVVQCIKSSITINKPPGVADGENWDCNVTMCPFWVQGAQYPIFQTAYSMQDTNYLLQSATDVGARQVGPITITKCPTSYTGSYLNPFRGGNASTTTLQTEILGLNANYTTGAYRVISQGFEVLNTTATLTVQGLATAYRVPVPTMESSTTVQTARVIDGSSPAALKTRGPCSILCMPETPNNPQEALMLPNTKQWLAKEGCYVVAHLNDPETRINSSSYTQPYFKAPAAPSNSDQYGNMPIPATFTVYANDEIGLSQYKEMNWTNFDISGCFFTGLSSSTSLTINWNVYIERFPAETEPDLVVIAKPSPQYCPMAFELYKAIALDLPVGVMQKENGLGDWFRDAVSTATEFISPIAAMIPHPAAQAVAGISKMVGGMTRRQESQTPYVSEQAEKAFVSKPRLSRSPVRKIKKEIKEEAKKEAKKEIKPFLKKSKMSVMPSAKKAHRK